MKMVICGAPILGLIVSEGYSCSIFVILLVFNNSTSYVCGIANLLFGPYNWNGIEGVDMEYCSWDGPDLKVCNFHHYEEGLIYLARQSGAEIWPSIGGWSLSDPFPVMAKNKASREKFVSKCVELIEAYGFDGIDIDWEYPGYQVHSGTPDDIESYNLLLQGLREQLDELGEKTGKFYGLTAGELLSYQHDVSFKSAFLIKSNYLWP